MKSSMRMKSQELRVIHRTDVLRSFRIRDRATLDAMVAMRGIPAPTHQGGAWWIEADVESFLSAMASPADVEPIE